MITAALLLAMIGIADLTRSIVRDESRDENVGGPVRSHRALDVRGKRTMTLVISAFWAVMLVSSMWLLGMEWWWALAATVLAAGWLATTTSHEEAAAPLRLWPALGVLLGTLAFAVIDTTDPTVGTPAGIWHSTAAPEWIREIPLASILVAIGVGLFLLESSNIVVRSALRPGSIHRRGVLAEAPVPLPDLRGGRLIGPLERLGLLTLTLAGMFTIVASLIAAKGIVRFPEISNDGATGSKAEYFLVGSLFSWGLSLLGVGLIRISG
ncbi:hypothetical protein [Paeniglutamicibacter kerguelensis]|uniref:Uncharacterized protein n=1 Tax=Paeniglutamicibacter kerguelensis TaxID=254788 RepID=A0ABS4XF76_9MICC|nr:hypothetical protein [Paeniglutamicibacter kerguelensis]MBP2387122.1 hypothetical protein [Paeniglutamicibacter kerguelensis]